jgi:hypothetical protein
MSNMIHTPPSPRQSCPPEEEIEVLEEEPDNEPEGNGESNEDNTFG